MKNRVVTMIAAGAAACSLACGPSSDAKKPTSEPAPAPPPAAVASASASPSASASASASPSASASAPPPVAAEVVTTSVTAVSNEVTTPNIVTPDKVIAGLRPKFNACYQDGLKKDPKLEGSVTLSAKIEKDGKVSAVTPKLLTGLSPAVVKCLSDHLKAASFAAAGGMNYTTSLDIPVGFTSR